MYIQESVKAYLMQKYRNLRRSTDPIQSKSTKKQTALFASPRASFSSVDIEEGDQIIYDRTQKSLMESYSAKPPDIPYVTQLMKLTFKKRRKLITESTNSTLTLKIEHPYFGNKLWVCHIALMFYFVFSYIFFVIPTQVQAEFQLICGTDCIEKITKNWINCIPKLLSNRKNEAEFTEGDQLQVFELLESALRPPGGAAKSPAAFGIYKVANP